MIYLVQIIFVSFLGLQNAFAEPVVTPVLTSKKWTVQTVTGHSAWNSESCIATTPSSTTADSVVEVYSEKVGDLYAEPTVQVLFKEPKQVYSAEVNTDKGTKWTFTLASVAVDPELQVVMARLKDREAIIKSLKSDSTLTVKLRDAKGKAIKTMQYSLSGSSKGIDGQFSHCALKFEEVP